MLCVFRAGTLYLDVRVVSRNGDELRQAFAEPHGDVSLHIDGEGLEAFLQAADSEIAQAADVLTQVNPSYLRQAQTTHGDETCRNNTNTHCECFEKVTLTTGKMKGIKRGEVIFLSVINFTL